jgi:enoyl-CoA hydratase
MGTPVSYQLDDSVATITMNDGKVNALSLNMLTELNEALDRAERDKAVVVLTGREGLFSAGFDLPVLRAGGADAAKMLRGGFDLAERVLSFPRPVAIACSGHAIAMAVFLLLTGDYRVGATGPYKITANEVAIGMTLPRAAIELCRQRLSPAAFNRATVLAEVFSPDDAVAAGFLDRAVEPSQLGQAVRDVAVQMATLDMDAHAATKRRVREKTLKALHEAIESDSASFSQQVSQQEQQQVQKTTAGMP